MGDYQEQQAMEIEALESILMDDLQEDNDTPSGWKPTSKVYRVEISPQIDGDTEILAEVVFSHTPTYPDAPPLVKARSVRGLGDGDIESLQAVVAAQVEENLGMPMIYQLITAVQEWMTDKGTAMAAPTIDPEAERKRLLEVEEARIAELRAHGTAVTPETFAEWKAKYDAEVALAKASLQDGAAVASKGKMSGRAYFQSMEAQHIELEEPDLEDDEEDGEGSRSTWSGEDPTDYFGKELLEASDSDDDVLDAILAGAENT